MKVKELIERLKTADPEAEVLINTYDDSLDIVACCNRRRKTACGYKWEYVK